MSAEKSDSTAVEGTSSASPISPKSSPEDGPAAKDESSTALQLYDKKSVRWWLLVCCVLCCTLLYSLDNSILADVAPVVVRDFGHAELLPWCSLAYTLTGTATILPYGQFFRTFNVKWTFIVSVVLFEVGSAICGAAPNMNAFILGRAIAGFGGTGLFLGGITIFSITTEEHERPFYMALNGLPWAFGMILGPLIGGGFAESSATWRWGFYINLPVAAPFVPVMLFFIPNFERKKHLTTFEKAKEIDWLGTVLSCGAFASGTMAMSFGGVLFPWDDRRIIAMFVLSVVLFSLFFFTQSRSILTTPERRIFPMEFWKSRTLILLGILVALGGGEIFTAIFYLPPLFQFVDQDTPIEAAVRLLPLVCLGVAFIMVNGALMPKTKYYKPWFLVGTAISTAAGALLFTIDENTSKGAIHGYTILLGAGIGSYYQACITLAQINVGKEKVFTAITFIAAMQSVGVVLALGVSGAIFVNVAMRDLAKALPDATPDQVSSSLTGGGSELFASLPQDVQLSALRAVVTASDSSFAFIMASAALSFILSWFLRWEKAF